MFNRKIYGWLPDSPDQRDLLYSAIKPKIRIPRKVDLRRYCSVVENEERLAVMPKKGERMIGGHAVLAVGYNQREKRFLVRNSWGTKWGMHGYFTMLFEYIETLASDFWTIRK